MWHYFKAVCKVFFPILWTYFGFIKKAFKHKDKYPLELRYQKCRKLFDKVLSALQADIHVFGIENLPSDGVYSLFSNHISMIDPLLYIHAIDKPVAIVAKKELEKAPFVPACLGCMDGLFIDRDDLKQSFKLMMKVQDDLTSGNHNWLIFPEGTRNKDIKMKLLDFHHGTFRPSFKSQTPIVPCVIYGTKELLSNKLNLKKYPIYVKFLSPLYYEDYKNMATTDIASLVQSKIQQDLTYNARVWHNKYMSELNSKK